MHCYSLFCGNENRKEFRIDWQKLKVLTTFAASLTVDHSRIKVLDLVN